jgi:beta-N-acetylhexosaminidase
MSDDISMNALSGSVAERSRAALTAGCDIVLHCNGDLTEMVAVATGAPKLAGESARRADAALRLRSAPAKFDTHAAHKVFAQMMGDDRTAAQRKIVS